MKQELYNYIISEEKQRQIIKEYNTTVKHGASLPAVICDIFAILETDGDTITALVDLAPYTATIERLNVRDLRRVRSGWNSDGYIYPLLIDLSEQEARQAHRQMWDEIATAECGFY